MQLRNDCRGHSLHSAWKGEKAHVGRRRGRKETGRGENAEGKKGPRGVRGTDTQTWGSAPAPHPPRNRVHSAGCNASNLPPTVAEAPPGWCVSHLVISDSLRSPELQSARLLRPWDFPGKDTGVGCHTLGQGIFPTQGSNLDLPFCRRILYRLSHQGRQPPGKPLPQVYSSQRIKRHCLWFFNLGWPHRHRGTFSLPRGPSFPH